MYNKKIYQEWEMHQDATQLEIKYKFLVRTINILTIKSLIENVDENPKEISDIKKIKKWKSFELEKTIDNFYSIINDDSFFRSQVPDYYSIFEKAIFLLGIVLNVLKKTNYKANELEIYYEPRLFAVAQKVLKMERLENWVTMMSSRINNARSLDKQEQEINLSITIDRFNINNVIWYLENLCLSFKEISTWYNNLFSISNINPDDKSIIVNIMNYMIVYNLTDFYVKLTFLYSRSTNFNVVYEYVLSSIKSMLEQGQFAINAYKEIAKFIAKILADHYIDCEDHIVNDFLEITKISCSFNNQKYFEETIFKLLDDELIKKDHERVSRNEEHEKENNDEFSKQASNNQEQNDQLNQNLNNDAIISSNAQQDNHQATNIKPNEGLLKVNEYTSLDELANNNAVNKNQDNNQSVNKINISSYKAFKQANQQNNKPNNVITPNASFNTKARLISKNLQNEFFKDEDNLKDDTDEIQRILNKKTDLLSRRNTNPYNFNNQESDDHEHER